MTKITVLGLGAMGSRMAERLIAGGHDVTVWNRSAGATEAFQGRATIAGTPRDAANGAEIVLAMVRDDDAARAVWLGDDGAFAAMAAGVIAIESSTVTPARAADFHAAAAARGIEALDAPVAGSLPQAAAGQLIFLVGGDAATLDRARPALDAMGGAIHHVGAASAGSRIKLAINALLGVQVAAAAELMGTLAAQGIAMDKAAEVIGAVPVASLALRSYLAGMAAGLFAPMFPVAMIDKDLGYAEAMAAGAPLPLTMAARAVYQRAGAAGLAEENMNAVVKLYR
ncbi:NAD(P)-dependent oxidoreductase [Sphingomonas sp. GlSt437]|uniref:NAD(P)-dependent oxidoreductase n=1 Tax=Sphingomonas sp. GlSt437 TaxID=3389970 RepID=UPI003A89334A